MFSTDNMTHNNSEFLVIAGPCALESEEQITQFLETCPDVKNLRAGIFKMRTNAESFQGLGHDGLEIIGRLKEKYNFKFVTEITDPRQIELFDQVVDCYQVGSRNMYNYDLLKELNGLNKPVLLKRAFSATINEWVNACGYMPDLGEDKVILCERGIRTFETTTRNTLDINSVIYLKQNYKFKVIVDPSHGAGIHSMVAPLSKVAMAAGADGILVESHPEPAKALSDSQQQITPAELNQLKSELQEMGKLFNKTVI